MEFFFPLLFLPRLLSLKTGPDWQQELAEAFSGGSQIPTFPLGPSYTQGILDCGISGPGMSRCMFLYDPGFSCLSSCSALELRVARIDPKK